MNTLQNAKKRYEEIEIPEELSVRISEEIARADKRRWKVAFPQKGQKYSCCCGRRSCCVYHSAEYKYGFR